MQNVSWLRHFWLRVRTWLLSSIINILVYELTLAKIKWPARRRNRAFRDLAGPGGMRLCRQQGRFAVMDYRRLFDLAGRPQSCSARLPGKRWPRSAPG